MLGEGGVGQYRGGGGVVGRQPKTRIGMLFSNKKYMKILLDGAGEVLQKPSS